MRLARSCLSVRETCGLRSLERLGDQWLHTLLIERLVVSSMLKDIVESEVMLLDVLGEIDFLPEEIEFGKMIEFNKNFNQNRPILAYRAEVLQETALRK